MDKLVRKLTDKATAQPIVNADVKARPVGVPDGSGDINMPETPPGSGIYATVDQIVHDTYKIVVNGSDSLDEYTVEAGRIKVRSGVGAFLYPLIDRVLDAKLYLSGLIGDSSSTASSSDFQAALYAATASSTLKRELVLTQDAATTNSDVTLLQDLLIDLNGFSLTLNANISSVGKITVRNGRLISASLGPKILGGTWTTFINVEFSGSHIEMGESDTITYAGCTGLASLPGSNGFGPMPSVAGGKHAFATALGLKLTDFGAKTGSGRLSVLQGWVNEWLSNSSRMGILAWLLASKVILDLWVTASSSMREAFAAGDIVIDNVKGATNLGTDANGKVIPVTAVSYTSVDIDDDLTVGKDLVVTENLSAGTIRSDKMYSASYLATDGETVSGECRYIVVNNSASPVSITIANPPSSFGVGNAFTIREMTILSLASNNIIITAKFKPGAVAASSLTWDSTTSRYTNDSNRAIKLIWTGFNGGQWQVLSGENLK